MAAPAAPPIVKPAKKPRRPGGRFANIKRGPREDIPEVLTFRSAPDANTYRWIRWIAEGHAPLDPYMIALLGEHGQVINVEYEKEHGYPATYTFPGLGTTGRAKYTSDVLFQALWTDVNHNTGHKSYVCMWFYVEGKTTIKEGGWLRDMDLKPLARIDSTSAEKLRRWKKYRPGEADRTLVLGQREYKVLCDIYSKVIRHWEK